LLVNMPNWSLDWQKSWDQGFDRNLAGIPQANFTTFDGGQVDNRWNGVSWLLSTYKHIRRNTEHTNDPIG
jgi:hypothetical protein